MKNWLIIFAFLICFACSLKDNSSTVIKFANKQIYFPDSLPVINNVTFQIDSNVFKSHNLKLITFVNGDCSVCIEHLINWEKFFDNNELNLYDIEFITILISHNLETFIEINKYIKFNYAILYDKDDVIRKKNDIPDSQLTKFFLLDPNNKVLLLGDPISNPKVKDIYLEVIKSHKNT